MPRRSRLLSSFAFVIGVIFVYNRLRLGACRGGIGKKGDLSSRPGALVLNSHHDAFVLLTLANPEKVHPALTPAVLALLGYDHNRSRSSGRNL